MRPFRHPLFWLLLGWVGVGVLIYLSLTSTPMRIPLSYGDKLGHLTAYMLLMTWFVQLYQRRGWLVFHAILLLILGTALEFVQEMRGRHFEYADMLANSVGVLLGSMVVMTPWRDLLLRLESRLVRR